MNRVTVPPVPVVNANLGDLWFQKWDDTDQIYRDAWVVGVADGVKQWLHCHWMHSHPDQELYPGMVLSLGGGSILAPTWVSRETAYQHLRDYDALMYPPPPPNSPISESSTNIPANIQLYNRRGCAFYEYIGDDRLATPPISPVDADIGVLFLQKREHADEYHAGWMVAEADGSKQWVRCPPGTPHPNQQAHAGKVLIVRNCSPAWVSGKQANTWAAKMRANVNAGGL